MDATRRELDELQSSLRVAMNEIAALRDQVTQLETALANERDEKAKAEARVKELSGRVAELEATAARLTIERDAYERLIRDRMVPIDGSGSDGAGGKPSTKDVLEAARAVSAEHEARHGSRKTGEQPAVQTAQTSAPEAGERAQGTEG